MFDVWDYIFDGIYVLLWIALILLTGLLFICFPMICISTSLITLLVSFIIGFICNKIGG